MATPSNHERGQAVGSFGVKELHQFADFVLRLTGDACRANGLDLKIGPANGTLTYLDRLGPQSIVDGVIDCGVGSVPGFSLDGWHSQNRHYWPLLTALSAVENMGLNV